MYLQDNMGRLVVLINVKLHFIIACILLGLSITNILGNLTDLALIQSNTILSNSL